ncbi:MAG TPA: glycosyltransferase family 39 protein [Candidatus Eisenbacteria bacterium]
MTNSRPAASPADKRLAWALFLGALVIRLAYIALRDLGQAVPAGTDAVSYDAFARAILAGTGWIAHPGPELFRPPGFPMILAVQYAIFGGNLDLVQLSQAVVGAASVVLVFEFGRRQGHRSAALLAALWLMVNPLHLDFAGKLLRENWLVLLNVAVIASLLADAGLKPGGIIRTGLLFTFLMHIDSRYVFHLPFFALYLLLAQPDTACPFSTRRLSSAVRPTILFVIVVLAASAPWAIRNAVAYDRFVLIDPRTLDRWVGGRHDAMNQAGDPAKESLPAFEAAKSARLDSLSTEERAAFRAGVRPRSGAVNKAIFNFTEFWRVWHTNDEYRPFPDTRFAGRWSTEHNASSLLFMGALLPFFLVGVVRGVAALDRPVLVMTAFIAVHTLLHVAVHSVTRYRLPVEPLYALIAFNALVALMPKKEPMPLPERTA